MIDTNQSTGNEPAASDVRAWLRRGILAARAGDRAEARRCFTAARAVEPDNIVALLYSAWLAPDPQESTALLIRVLELDPKNEHAHAGLRWARRQPPSSQKPPDPPPSDGPGGGDAPPGPEAPSDPSVLRDALLSSDIQEGARKGAVAQRARRLIGPLGLLLAVACLLVLAGVILVTWYSAASVLASLPHLGTEAPTALLADALTPTFTAEPSAQPPVGTKTPAPTVEPTHTPSPSAQPPGGTATSSPTATLTPSPSPLPTETDTPVPTPTATAAPSATPSPTATLPPPPPSPTATAVPAAPPPPGANGEKWIDVDLTKQQLTAYQGTSPVFQALVSTGLPGTPTVIGQFRIYWKLVATDMAGPGYYLPAVPYTMYFLRGYSLHGTYWHHNFGQPMSHGCVNLRTEDAKWLFDWTDPPLPAGATQVQANGSGTLVVVHN